MMCRSLLTSIFIAVIFAATVIAQTDGINIIPRPRTVSKLEGEFRLTTKTKIVTESRDGRVLAEQLNHALLRDYGFQLDIVARKSGGDAIYLLTGPLTSANDGENYKLVVSANHVEIAGEKAGAFYALQTLIQSMRPGTRNNEIVIPSIGVIDGPRFKYRGMHLDVGRHFMPVEFVKKYIDLMSQYKFNYFHWHLTEDQGWRIEIKKYPRLTTIGSKRPETMKDKNFSPYVGDGVPVEGFYTQEQIRDVVAYAKARYITVVPEIELPGHSSAALAAYPELGCKADYNYKVQTTWGIFKEVYCPTEKTFSFLEDVLSEVIDLFPDSPYIHIGGDEVLIDQWKDSPQVKELMTREGLKDMREVESYFVRRMERFINSKGKKIIGWDEILEGGLAPNATVMSWRGTRGGIEAARAKHDVIMTPTDYVYLDYCQGDTETEPINQGGYVPLAKVYSFDPMPKELAPDETKYILGGQGNVWTEYLKTPATVEYMAFPRMLALSEVLWSTPENKNFADFSKRLSANLPRLDSQHVNYRIPEPDGLRNMVVSGDQKAVFTFKTPADTIALFYSIGTAPDWTPFDKRIKNIGIDLKQGERADLRVVEESGTRRSSVYTATILRRDYLPASELKEKRPGVTYMFIVPPPGDVGNPTITTGETTSIGLQQFSKTADLKSLFGVIFDGYFNAPVDEIYEFQVDATWNTTILIDGETLIDDLGTKDVKTRSGIVPLKSGFHKISLRFSHRGGEAAFHVQWRIKGQDWHDLYGGGLVH